MLFLSYGRGDDEPFVRRLHARLEGEGYDVWWDRVRMPSRSLTFLKEIREAVHASDRVLVVVGPSCLTSDYCRAEWQAALAAAKVVTPILRLGDYEQLPPELAGLHCPDLRLDTRFDEKIGELLRILAEPVPPLGALHGGVPDVPPHFQPRPGVTSELASIVLLDDRTPAVLTGPERVTVLHGMGGVGKSVLAAAFARATTTRRSFSAGVFWLSGGDTSAEAIVSRLALLVGLVPVASGDLISELTTALEGRNALVVVDDAWHVDQVAPLINALGSSCRLLITSRSGALATGLGARPLPLEVLTEDEALRHLADWTGTTPEDLPPEALDVARACGRLPFALALHGAMRERGADWTHLLAALNDAEIDYAEQRFKDYPYPTVLASLKVSMDALDGDDVAAGQRLRELAGFQPAGGIPEAAVQRLWAHTSDLSPRHVAKVLAVLAERALLRVDDAPQGRRVRIHDLQYDYLICVTDAAACQTTLLDAYEAASGGDWARVPADGYVHRHIVRHLLNAGREDSVRELLNESTPDGRNAWYEAQLAAEDAVAYLADLDAVLEAAAEDDGRALHLLLMRASVREVLAKVPAEVRVAMLRAGATNPDTALTAAAAVSDPERRVSEVLAAAAALEEHDPQRERALIECLATVRGRGGQVRARLLPRIAELSPPAEREALVAEALQAARAVTVASYRASALAAITRLIDGEIQGTVAAEAEQALRDSLMSASFRDAARDVLPLRPGCAPELMVAASAIGEPFLAAMAYEAIVPHLPEEDREAAAREGIRRFEDSGANGLWIVISLARHVPGFDLDGLVDRAATQDPRQMRWLLEQLDDLSADTAWKAAVVARVSAVADDFSEPSRTMTRIALLGHLPQADRADIIDDLLTVIAGMPYDTWRSEAFVALVPYLDADRLRVIGRSAARLDDAADVLASAAGLARYADEGLRETLRAAVDTMPASNQRFAALVALAEASEDAERRSATAMAACAVFDQLDLKIGVAPEVARLSSLLESPTRERLLQAAVRTPLMLGSLGDFLVLAPLLPEDAVLQGHRVLLAEAERRSRHRQKSWSDGPVVTDNASAVADTLASLAPVLPKALVGDALAAVGRMTVAHWRFVAACHLVPNLDAAMRAEQVTLLLGPDAEAALAAGLQGDDAGRLASAACRGLCRVAAVVDGDDLGRCRQLIGVLATWIEPAWLSTVLETISPQLDATSLESLIERALGHGGPYAALAVAKVVPPPRRYDLLLEALDGTSADPLLNATEAILDAPDGVRERAWAKVRVTAKTHDRKQIATTLSAMAPLATSLNRRNVLESAANSLVTVTQWWP